MAKQTIQNGGSVMIQGYEMLVSEISEVTKGGVACVQFKGTCTSSPRNEAIRGTGYDGGIYGGSNLVYSWEV